MGASASSRLPRITAVKEPFLNVAAYRFVPLHDLPALRAQLMQSAEAAALKGTVLLAEEGINFNLAGEPAALRAWLNALMADGRFKQLPLKFSDSETTPFKRLKVRIKREIIRMNQPTVRPAQTRAEAVSATTLARWLQAGRCDAGRELVLLDTRNSFEVDTGAFEAALDWRLKSFSDFPAALSANADTLSGKTVVSYCTGGIRCEKAALWMAQAGVEHPLQLDGGILGYFEQVPGARGWRGRCFVFDEREGLDHALQAAA